MYQVVLGLIPLPITPSKIETKVGGRNETLDLCDGSQINIIKAPALTEIEFDFMLPHQSYPFASTAGSLMGAVTGALGGLGGLAQNMLNMVMLDELDRMFKVKKPFNLSVLRKGQGTLDILIWNSCLKVTLEEYAVTEDADNGLDIMVHVKLKKYVEYGTTILNDDGTVSKTYVR